MTYTIMESTEVQSGQKITLEKCGNEYLVVYTSDEEGNWYHTYPSCEAARRVVQKFLDAFMTGCYDAKTRASWLASWLK